MEMSDIIEELYKFSDGILELGESVEIKDIEQFESKYNIRLPADYKILITKYNGLSLMGTEIYGIKKSDGKYSIEDCYLFEHFEVENAMPIYLVPFSPDGRGNHYCFDTRTQDNISCPICFWRHDYSYSRDNQPEIVNDSFFDWVKEVVIGWTLEDYDYEGNPL